MIFPVKDTGANQLRAIKNQVKPVLFIPLQVHYRFLIDCLMKGAGLTFASLGRNGREELY